MIDWTVSNRTDPDKAEALAHAFMELMRLNLTVSSMDAAYPETDEYKNRYERFVAELKVAEEELFYRFKEATGRTMYRVGSELYVDGVIV